MNPLQVLFDFTISFYQTTTSLWNWFSNDISLLGSTFTPFQMIFNWGTLIFIVLAVLAKKVVPLI
jgi:hypothetical membrane protein